MVMHPFVYNCGLVGYVYGNSFVYTLLENRLLWQNYVFGSGFGKISKEMLHGSSSSVILSIMFVLPIYWCFGCLHGFGFGCF